MRRRKAIAACSNSRASSRKRFSSGVSAILLSSQIGRGAAAGSLAAIFPRRSLGYEVSRPGKVRLGINLPPFFLLVRAAALPARHPTVAAGQPRAGDGCPNPATAQPGEGVNANGEQASRRDRVVLKPVSWLRSSPYCLGIHNVPAGC
jgi:hypothetical protein